MQRVSDSTPDRMNSPIRASKCEPPGGLQRVHGHVNATARRADDHLQVVTCARSVHAAHGMAPAVAVARAPAAKITNMSCTSSPHYCCCLSCSSGMGSAICSPRRGADAQSLDQQSQGHHLLPVNEMFSDHNHFIEVEIF